MQAVDRGALEDLAGEALLFQGVEEREKVRFVVLIEPGALDDVGQELFRRGAAALELGAGGVQRFPPKGQGSGRIFRKVVFEPELPGGRGPGCRCVFRAGGRRGRALRLGQDCQADRQRRLRDGGKTAAVPTPATFPLAAFDKDRRTAVGAIHLLSPSFIFSVPQQQAEEKTTLGKTTTEKRN